MAPSLRRSRPATNNSATCYPPCALSVYFDRIACVWAIAAPSGRSLVSNRHERRQQAAKARYIAKAVSSIRLQDEGNMIVGPRSAEPDDIKADIALVVRSIKFTGSTGGDCLLRGRDRPPRVATFG